MTLLSFLSNEFSIGEVIQILSVVGGAIYIVARLEISARATRDAIAHLQRNDDQSREAFAQAMKETTSSLHGLDKRVSVLEQRVDWRKE